VQGIPFVGLNTKPGSLWVKDAATLEKELQTILEAGGDTLMVCSGADMLAPGIFEIFRKYCGK
jgi:predicted ribosome-associated RNA-binding protein Tma20